MKVVSYTADHYEEIASWFEKRKLPPIPKSSLPKEGFLVPGVGAIFLYQMDCDVCQIETAITNPEIPKEFRDRCIDAVTEAALKKAKGLGFRVALSYSYIPKIIKQATERHGYEKASESYALMWRNLWAV
jgi:hypothetical protein